MGKVEALAKAEVNVTLERGKVLAMKAQRYNLS
jgi:hypothetical protein